MKINFHRFLFLLVTLLFFESSFSQEIMIEEGSDDQSANIEETSLATEAIEPSRFSAVSDEIRDKDKDKDKEKVKDKEKEGQLGDDLKTNELKEGKATINSLNSQLSGDFTSNYQLEEHRNKWILQYRYLGVLSQVGVERALGGQISAGLYYGRYAGKVAGTDKLGFIPDLEHVALQFNAYLNKDKVALANGIVTRFALHVNRQKENDLVKSIQVDGVDVIIPGQTKVGTLLGIGYQYNWKMVSLNAGMEYLTMGPLKSFVPLAIGVGITF
jgi:hypothetical protein